MISFGSSLIIEYRLSLGKNKVLFQCLREGARGTEVIIMTAADLAQITSDWLSETRKTKTLEKYA